RIPIPAVAAVFTWSIVRDYDDKASSSVTATAAGWLTIQPETPRQLGWYLEQQSRIGMLLAMIGGAPMPPDCISASVDDAAHEVSVLVMLNNLASCPYVAPRDFFMLRSEMDAGLDHAMLSWFDSMPKLERAAQLAHSVLASGKQWLHVEFLSLMQA